jgi:hypothetical protein
MTEGNEDPKPDDKLGRFGTWSLAIYNDVLAAAVAVALILLINSGPAPLLNGASAGPATVRVARLPVVELHPEVWLLLLVMMSGALGSYVHSCTSFTDYAGNRALTRSWVWWYLLRTPIGIALAVVFYFLLRGGLLTTASSGANLNVYGLAAIAALAGMFSKNATDKLREIFEAMFRTAGDKGDEMRKNKLKAGE